ncbi:MAG: hypothetical protein WED10_09260 [Brumimicrobium sp.]
MLRKSIVIGAATLALGLTSCGGGMPSTMCECMEIQVEMMEKTMDLEMDDTEGREKVQEEYKKENEACEKLGKAFQDKNKDLSSEEKQAAQEKELDGCDAMEKMEKLYEKQMEGMKK